MVPKSNKGFSLIEMLVVIMLLGLLVGMLVPALTPMISSEARKCASQVDALLAKGKVYAMSRSADVYIRIYEENGKIWGEHLEGTESITSEMLGNGKMSVTVTMPDGSTKYTVNATNHLYVSFHRATGALRVFGKTDNAEVVGVTTGNAQIAITAGGKTYKINIVPSTGKHEVTQ